MSRVERVFFGRDAATGLAHELITLHNGAGLSASFTTYGAQLVSLRCPPGRGAESEVTLNYRTLDDILAHNRSYFGATVGRYANRIAGGSFAIDGEVGSPCFAWPGCVYPHPAYTLHHSVSRWRRTTAQMRCTAVW
jgi:hypothetical protein